jgi:hypothetical protein
MEKEIKGLNPHQCGLGVIGKSPRPLVKFVSLLQFHWLIIYFPII